MEGGANAAVVQAFTGAADEVKATVLAIAGVAVGILIVMYAFKWGKKILFQSLIGTLKTSNPAECSKLQDEFQSLIGTLKTYPPWQN